MIRRLPGLAAGQQQPPLPQRRHHLPRRPELGEQDVDLAIADRTASSSDSTTFPLVVVVQSDRQQLPQLPAGGLMPQASVSRDPQHVELSLGHLPLRPRTSLSLKLPGW